MSGKESKRAKGRRSLYSHQKSASSNGGSAAALGLGATGGATATPFQPFGSGVTMNVNEVATEFGLTLKSSTEDAEKITELMDAPMDLYIPAPAISRGPNPYLDRCMYCNTPRTTSLDGDEGLELLDLQLDGNTVISSLANSQSFSSLKLEIWTCANCRKVAGKFQSFLEANFPQASYEPPFIHEKACVDPLCCSKCQESCESQERWSQEIHENWLELRSIVKEIYSATEEPVLSEEKGNQLRYLVDKLCSRDPHDLFRWLETQVRETVGEMKTSLLNQLKEKGYNSPELALDFTRALLSHYDLLTKKAHLLAQYLGGLSEHLRRFKVTWELLNKHLFHSIAHSDPAISTSGPTILEQLRQGSVQYERSKDDPYFTVRKHLQKFQAEMSVVVVVWRDCQQLIENYCREEVKNTQKQVSSKARTFISQQRQFLKEQLSKEPFMDEALSETMKNLMSGHKSSTERVRCHRCSRERCTCDECTITHMITCGIINSDKGEILPPPNSFNFALDHTRNVMDITPPSMSSTTSSSGSVSPINIEDKITTFYDCEKVLNDDISDAIMNCDECEHRPSTAIELASEEIDGNVGDDEDGYGEDGSINDEGLPDTFPDGQDTGSDEPHALQIPICELKDADVLWEVVQQHQQQQLLQQHKHFFCDQRDSLHTCSHCENGKKEQCPFQPRIDPELSRQLEAELAKSGLLPGGAGDFGSEVVTDSETGSESHVTVGDGPSAVNPNVCATCQCHACLKQSGQGISTTLPLQMPVSPPPAELHLYPHIHGLPQQTQQQQPQQQQKQQQQRYYLDLPSPLMPPLKLPVKLDFDDPQEHLYNASSEWDTTMQPQVGSFAAQFHHQHDWETAMQSQTGSLAAHLLHHHQRPSALSSDLLPPPPLVTSTPFTFDLALQLATHTTHTSTTNTTSAFKSVAGKHMASSFFPPLNIANAPADGSSVDPSKPLDFASLSKIPQSCISSASSASSFSPSLSFSCPSSTVPTSSNSMPAASVNSLASRSNGSCHGPPCPRPAPVGGNATTSKWERNHPQHCKKFTAGSGLHGKPVAGNQGHMPFQGSMQSPGQLPVPQSSPLKNFFHGQHDDVLRSLRTSVPCTHTSSPAARPSGLSTPASTTPSPGIPVPPVPGDPSVPLLCTNSLSSVVNTMGVGTPATCSDPECDVHHHHDDNCDSVDDSCSEKSSSTSTSNQKEGKYCDCCYCEFFGHNNTQVAKTSTNYIEMKDRLRKKLKKRQSENKQVIPKNGLIQEKKEELKEPLGKRGLEELLNFINGTDEETQKKAKEAKEIAKAAKRARQKQKRLEEKTRQEGKSSSPEKNHHHPEPEKTLHQLILNQTLHLSTQSENSKESMTKPKAKKPSQRAGKMEMEEERSVCKETSLSPSKQEIIRSSLIIESTRPTISRSSKDQKSVNNNKDTPHHMKEFLGVLQSLKQQQQKQQLQQQQTQQLHQQQQIQQLQQQAQQKQLQQAQQKQQQQQNHKQAQSQTQQTPTQLPPKNKASSPAGVAKNSLASQVKSNGAASVPAVNGHAGSANGVSKSGTEGGKSNGAGKQHQVQTSTPQSCPPKQQSNNKAVNGKSSNHTLTNGRSSAIGGKQQPQQHLHMNGGPGKVPVVSGTSSTSVTATATSVTTSSASRSPVVSSPSAGSGSSASQSPSSGTKTVAEQGKANGKTKKNKKKNKNGDINCLDEIFMPKSEAELDGDVDDFERELEEFKRFCFEPAEPKERRKIAVNVNLKDIFKKKTGLV